MNCTRILTGYCLWSTEGQTHRRPIGRLLARSSRSPSVYPGRWWSVPWPPHRKFTPSPTSLRRLTRVCSQQSYAYANEMLETERYRFLFYANKPPKIQQFTHVRRHWEKNTAGIPKISCLLLFNFALFSPRLLSQVSAQLKKFIS